MSRKASLQYQDFPHVFSNGTASMTAFLLHTITYNTIQKHAGKLQTGLMVPLLKIMLYYGVSLFSEPPWERRLGNSWLTTELSTINSQFFKNGLPTVWILQTFWLFCHRLFNCSLGSLKRKETSQPHLSLVSVCSKNLLAQRLKP